MKDRNNFTNLVVEEVKRILLEENDVHNFNNVVTKSYVWRT